LAVTLIFPPAAVTSTVFSSSSACALAICACICCACFINLFRFMAAESGSDLAFENIDRFANQWVVRVIFARTRGRRFSFGGQIFTQGELEGPVFAADFV